MFFLILILISCALIAPTKESDFANLDIVSDLLPQDCFDQDLDYKHADTDGLPKCMKFRRPTTCTQYHYPNGLAAGLVVYKPTCNKDGEFASKQCKGERQSGRCFCFNKYGQRIFGQNWWNKADDMTCACSARKFAMQNVTNHQYFNSLHCDSVGNYEPLQCDVTSQQCWCADPKTGDLTSPVVPYSSISKLDCYSTLTTGSQYLRQCESKMYAQQRILYELSLHGTTNASFGILLCDYDGSYGAYRVVDGSAYCTWRDNTNLGSYQYSGDRTSLTCNCARDKRIYTNAGKTLNLECTGGGNYEPLQKLTDPPYCVDQDGFRSSKPDAVIKPTETCDSYKSYNQ